MRTNRLIEMVERAETIAVLGHERPDVTDIYLASVKGGMSRGE